MKDETISRIRQFTENRDWDQFHSPVNLAKSIVIEAAEGGKYLYMVLPVRLRDSD